MSRHDWFVLLAYGISALCIVAELWLLARRRARARATFEESESDA